MVTHVRSMFSIAAGGAIVLTGLGATPAQSPHELDDYPQAGSATASSNAPCESPATFEGIVVDDAFRETWFEGSEESAPIETGAAPSVSLGELDGFEDIDAWAWSHNAGLVADRLESLLQASGESEIYSSVVIDSEHRRLSLHLKDAPSAQLRQDIIENAGEIPLDLFTDSRLSGDEFVETVAAMTKYLGDDRAQIAYISPDAEYSSVTVGIYSGMNYGTLAEIATGLLHPLEVIVVSVSPCESAAPFAGSRWDDQSGFNGGAAIANNGVAQCSTGFAASRDSDGVRVMLTAEHCGAALTWKTPLGGVTYGVGGARHLGTDSQILLPPAGSNFHSRIYRGSYTSSSTSDRKNSPVNAKIGDQLYAGGAFSGGSAQSVVAVNQYSGSIGPGFITVSNNGAANVGQGDSGGPVFRLHTDGKYTPFGMIRGQGWSILTGGVIVLSPLGACAKGILVDRQCSVRSFHVNASAIENALDVTIYEP